MGCCGGKEVPPQRAGGGATPVAGKGVENRPLEKGEVRNRKDYPVGERAGLGGLGPRRGRSPPLSQSPACSSMRSPSPLEPSIDVDNRTVNELEESRMSGYSTGTDKNTTMARSPSIKIHCRESSSKSDVGPQNENPLADGDLFGTPPPLQKKQSSKKMEKGGGRISSLYDQIDQEMYDLAFKNFREVLSTKSPEDPDFVVVSLGLAVLHNLGGEAWSRPQTVNNATSMQLQLTEEWLSTKLLSNPNSAAALLACSEYHHALNNKESEANYRLAASKTNHPLGVLRYNVHLLTKLRNERDAKTVSPEAYNTAKTDIIKVFSGLAIPNSRVAARAGKLIWVSYYKGTDGMKRDLPRAKEVLEKAIRFEQGDLKEMQGYLQRINEKISSERQRHRAGSAAKLTNAMRTPSPRGGQGGTLPPLPSGRAAGMESSRNKRSVSPSPGLARNSSICSYTTETHVEVDVNGTTFGVIRNSSINLEKPPVAAKGKVSSYDADILEDTYDDNASEMASSVVYSGGSEDKPPRVGSERHRAARRLGSARGDSISSTLRNTKNKSHLNDNSARYRTHGSRSQSSPSVF